MKKLIEIPDEVIKRLAVKAAEQGLNLTAYIRSVLVKDSNGVKTKSDATITIKDTVKYVRDIPLVCDTGLDITGKFIRVEKNIYTNKKCFQAKNVGGVDRFFLTLEDAKEYLEAKTK
jgi:hypothetical protein